MKNKVINIRGTSGAGKSTLVRLVMEHYGSEDLKNGTGKAVGHVCPSANLRIVGRYDKPCGGCDAVKTQDEIEIFVQRFARLGNVIFEGLLVSGITERYAELARSTRSADFIFAFLDTPAEVCVQRVSQRRTERDASPEFDYKNTIDRWNSLQRVRRKLAAAGLTVVELDHTDPLPAILRLLEE